MSGVRGSLFFCRRQRYQAYKQNPCREQRKQGVYAAPAHRVDHEADQQRTERQANAEHRAEDAECPRPLGAIIQLGGFRFVLCASPAYLAEYGAPDSPAELAAHKCIFFRFPATGLIQPWELRGMRLTGDFRSAAVMTVNNIEAAIRLSAAGMGIAYVPDFVVREAMDEGQLQEVLPGCCIKDGHFSVLWPASRYLSPRIRCFIDFMAAAEIPLSHASAPPPLVSNNLR